MNVRRFDIGWDGEELDDQRGEYVLHSDYAALEARYNALVEAERMMRTALRAKDADYVALRVAAGSLLSDVDEYFRCADISESRDKLAALVGEG